MAPTSTFCLSPGRAQDSGPACPTVPNSCPPSAGRREVQPPLGRRRAAAGARAPSSSPQRLSFSLEPPSGCRPEPEQALAQPGEAPPTTRLASGLEARGADVRRARIDWRASWGNKVPSPNTAEVFATNFVFPPAPASARAAPSHLRMEGGSPRHAGPACPSGEDGMHSHGAALSRKVL